MTNFYYFADESGRVDGGCIHHDESLSPPLHPRMKCFKEPRPELIGELVNLFTWELAHD